MGFRCPGSSKNNAAIILLVVFTKNPQVFKSKVYRTPFFLANKFTGHIEGGPRYVGTNVIRDIF